MNYNKLQAKAKDLGLKYVGVSKAELEAAIEAAENEPKEDVTTEEMVEETPKVEATPKKKTSKPTIAMVMRGNHEIRRYTLDQHGKEFADLADQYVSNPKHKGLTVVLKETLMPNVTCPHCGFKFVSA